MIMPILDVRDVRASADYYASVLGFQITTLLDGQDGQPAFAVVSRGQATFGLSRAAQAPAATVQFMVYLPDETDIDALYADVQAKGAVIRSPIEDGYWGDRTFTVADPDGYQISPCKTVRQMSNDEIQAAMKAQDD